MQLITPKISFLALLIFVPALLWATSSFSSGLPPEHEAKRLMLAAQNSINSKQWNKADQQLKNVTALDVPLPAEFHYMHGQVLFHRFEFDLAQKSFEVYVLQVGEEGEFYISALEMITEADEKKKEVQPKATDTEALTLDKAKDEYLESLKTLYLTDDAKQALVFQINNILLNNPYHGSRIKQQDVKKGVRYSINLTGNELQIQEKRYDKKGAPSLSVSRMDVCGVDPFIKYSCDYDRYVCWLYHPVNQHDRWILLDRNNDAAKELSEAMGRLIQSVQGG